MGWKKNIVTKAIGLGWKEKIEERDRERERKRGRKTEGKRGRIDIAYKDGAK